MQGREVSLRSRAGGSISLLEAHVAFLFVLIARQPDLTLDEIVAPQVFVAHSRKKVPKPQSGGSASASVAPPPPVAGRRTSSGAPNHMVEFVRSNWSAVELDLQVASPGPGHHRLSGRDRIFAEMLHQRGNRIVTTNNLVTGPIRSSEFTATFGTYADIGIEQQSKHERTHTSPIMLTAPRLSAIVRSENCSNGARNNFASKNVPLNVRATAAASTSLSSLAAITSSQKTVTSQLLIAKARL
jgi:hypothetical protein